MLKYTTPLTLEKKKKKKRSRAFGVSWVENIQKACAGSTPWLLSVVLPIVEQMVWVYSCLFLILDRNWLSLSEAVTGHKQQNAELLCLYVNVTCTCCCVLKKNVRVCTFLVYYLHMCTCINNAVHIWKHRGVHYYMLKKICVHLGVCVLYVSVCACTCQGISTPVGGCSLQQPWVMAWPKRDPCSLSSPFT